MQVTVDLKFWALVLTAFSFVCGCVTIAFYPRGTKAQTAAMLLTATVIGPLTPVMTLLLLPKVMSDIWISTVQKGMRRGQKT